MIVHCYNIIRYEISFELQDGSESKKEILFYRYKSYYIRYDFFFMEGHHFVI